MVTLLGFGAFVDLGRNVTTATIYWPVAREPQFVGSLFLPLNSSVLLAIVI